FNPETWIPFTLGEDTSPTLTIYSSAGVPVRTIGLGRIRAGAYVTRGKAIHWDGRNDAGEPVASGVYFIELAATSGFHAMRRLIVAR
ncbi:MAG: FlgD immunoglobulin-like domain containing protein, partial [bacterium]|nr:FlgD immunoglobulin-like domain containing protein [bacterium]